MDEGVHFLLFAVRDAIQDTLGFSPFELIFGHTVRGPLKLLKDNGKIGFIVLKALCYVDSWEKIRGKMFESTSLDFMIDCRKATKDAKIEQVIMIATNKNHPDPSFKVGKIKDFKVGKIKDFKFEINFISNTTQT